MQLEGGFGGMQLKKIGMNFLRWQKQGNAFFNNHPTVRVDSASSLCASPLSLYANL